ncbi:MAG: hypothetical protein RH942_03475 [Kiloniellaceae bacterium]
MLPLLSRLAAAVLLSTLLVSGASSRTLAQTQTQPDAAVQVQPRVIGGPLANISVLQMSVAPLSEQSRYCGLDSNLILDSFRQPLAEQGIVVQQSAHVWIQLLATTVLYEGDICISYIEARAIQNTRYFDRKTNTERSGRVLLWSDSGLFVTGAPNHGVTTNIGWRDLARSFMRKWTMDQ